MNAVILIIVPLAKTLQMPIILLWLKKLRRILKHLNLKLVEESVRKSIEMFWAKFTPKICQAKYLLMILCWKLMHERIEIKV